MKTHRSLKSFIAPLAVVLALPGVARADFNPVALTPGSYTYGIVVPSNAVPPVTYCVNAFVGTGTNFGDNTFYEQGMYTPHPSDSGHNSGVPVHGTTFTDINNANKTFMMPPSYTTSNDLMIVNSGSYGTITSGTLTLATPTTATSLDILDTGGNGGCTVNYTVNHMDSSTDTGTLTVQDWFNGGGFNAWGCNGRMDAGGNYNNFNSSAVNNQGALFGRADDQRLRRLAGHQHRVYLQLGRRG